jgi:hypothetical protein
VLNPSSARIEMIVPIAPAADDGLATRFQLAILQATFDL